MLFEKNKGVLFGFLFLYTSFAYMVILFLFFASKEDILTRIPESSWFLLSIMTCIIFGFGCFFFAYTGLRMLGTFELCKNGQLRRK